MSDRWIVGEKGAEDAADPRELYPIVTDTRVAGYAFKRSVAELFAEALNNRQPDPLTPEGYLLNALGEPECPHCSAATNRAYAKVPNLPCWKCGEPLNRGPLNE